VEERACGMDPAANGEAVAEALVVEAVGEAPAVEA
jgi:hypothetical protein